MASLTADCDSGVEVACEELSHEEQAKVAWLAKLDVPSWGAAAMAVSHVASGMTPPAPAPAPTSEEEAKAAWLAKLDAPVWGQAATALIDVAQIELMTEACNSGDVEACDLLTNEEEAKKSWLARLDSPTWGKAAAAVVQVASMPNMNEEVRGLLAIDPTARTLPGPVASAIR